MKKTVISVVLAIVLFFTSLLSLNSFAINGAFSKSKVAAKVATSEFLNGLLEDFTDGVVKSQDTDAVIIEDGVDIGAYLQKQTERQQLGLVTDEVIIKSLNTEVVSEKFAETAVSYAKSAILGKKETPLTEKDVTDMLPKLKEDVKKVDNMIISDTIAENILGDFEHNPKKLANETNGYLKDAFKSCKKANGFMSFGCTLPVLWLILSVIVCALILLFERLSKKGFLLSGAAVLLSTLVFTIIKGKYISLFGSNKFVLKIAESLLDKSVSVCTVVGLVIGVLLLVSAFIPFKKKAARK